MQLPEGKGAKSGAGFTLRAVGSLRRCWCDSDLHGLSTVHSSLLDSCPFTLSPKCATFDRFAIVHPTAFFV